MPVKKKKKKILCSLILLHMQASIRILRCVYTSPELRLNIRSFYKVMYKGARQRALTHLLLTHPVGGCQKMQLMFAFTVPLRNTLDSALLPLLFSLTKDLHYRTFSCCILFFFPVVLYYLFPLFLFFFFKFSHSLLSQQTNIQP